MQATPLNSNARQLLAAALDDVQYDDGETVEHIIHEVDRALDAHKPYFIGYWTNKASDGPTVKNIIKAQEG